MVVVLVLHWGLGSLLGSWFFVGVLVFGGGLCTWFWSRSLVVALVLGCGLGAWLGSWFLVGVLVFGGGLCTWLWVVVVFLGCGVGP